MKWFLMVMMFSSVGMAKITIQYGEQGQKLSSLEFELTDKLITFCDNKCREKADECRE